MHHITYNIRKFGIVAILVVAFLFFSLHAARGAESNEAPALKQALNIMTLLKNKQFDTVDSLTSPALKDALKQMGVDSFKSLWLMMESQLGVLQTIEEPYVATVIPQGTTVIVPGKFGNTVYDGYLTINSNSMLEGFVVRMHAERTPKGPQYIDKTKFDEQSIVVGTPEHPLSGSFAVPKGLSRYPAVIMLAGSGPSDKDETIGPNKPFRDIAYGLASNGIATLRFDKRTKVYHESPKGNQTIVDWEYLEDARACIDFLAKMPQISKIYVLGHSLGAQLAPEIAKERPTVAGVICLGGPVTPLEDLMLYQFKYLASLNLATASTVETYQKELESYRKDPSTPGGTLAGAPFRYFSEIRALGTAPEIAKTLKQPLFLAFGERDYQVPTTEIDLWKTALSGRPNVDIRVYQGLNHLFIKGEGVPNPDEYNIPANVDAAVIKDMTDWIKQH